MIKYRVWDKVDSRYLEATRKFDYYISSRGNLQVSSGYDSYKEPTYEEDTDQDRYIVELFTGLTDKNGVDIYEGDIVEYTDKRKENFSNPVTFRAYDDNECYVNGVHLGFVVGPGIDNWLETLPDAVGDGCEIVGNIHEVES